MRKESERMGNNGKGWDRMAKDRKEWKRKEWKKRMEKNGKKFGRNGKTKTGAKSSAKLRETPSQASG